MPDFSQTFQTFFIANNSLLTAVLFILIKRKLRNTFKFDFI